MRYLLLVCLLWGARLGWAQAVFRADTLHEIRLRFAQPAWADTLARWYDAAAASAPKQFLPVSVTIDGQKLGKDAGIRYKGEYSYTGFPGKKKPFRLHFNKFSSQNYQGIRKLNLHNLASDPSFLREHISYDLLRQLGLPASRTSFARLYINEVYWGCYLIVEEPEDKLFLQHNFGTDAGNLFESAGITRLNWKGPDPAAYKQDLELQTDARPDSWEKVLQWLDFFNNDNSYDFSQKFGSGFEADHYFSALAADVFLNNWDSYADNGHNFFLYDNPTTGKLHWIPWDYNLAMWQRNLDLLPRDANSTVYPYKPLIWRISQHPALRQAYYSRFCQLLNGTLGAYPIEAKTQAAHRLIAQAVADDSLKFYSTAAFTRNRTDSVTVTMIRRNALAPVPLPGITSLFVRRRQQLRDELAAAGCRCSQPAAANFPALAVSVFPNPGNGACQLYAEELLPTGTTAQVMVTNALGQVVRTLQITLTAGQADLMLSDLADSYYFLHVTADGKSANLKLLKQ